MQVSYQLSPTTASSCPPTPALSWARPGLLPSLEASPNLRIASEGRQLTSVHPAICPLGPGLSIGKPCARLAQRSQGNSGDSPSMQGKGAGEPGAGYRMLPRETEPLSESQGLAFLETLGSWDYEAVGSRAWPSARHSLGFTTSEE